MSSEQAPAAASTNASTITATIEQAYAVWISLLHSESRPRAGNRAPAATTTPRAEMALRAALHPLLRPALEDPLTTIGGVYVSLDSQVAAFAAPLLASPVASLFLARLPAADRATLARLGLALPPAPSFPSPSAAPSPRVGAMEGVLFVPGLRAGVVCDVRVWLAAGPPAGIWRRERLGWEPPRAVRPVAPAIAASATRALRAALLLLCAEDALPPDLRPGTIYFDVCAPLADDQIAGVAGESLEVPLTLAMLSALTRQPIAVGVGATGAIGIDESAGRLSVEPVGELAAKATAFFADVQVANTPSPRFLVPEETGELALDGVTPVATLRDAVALALPAWTIADARQSLVDSVMSDATTPIALHACIESDALRDAPALRRTGGAPARGRSRANRRRGARCRRAEPPAGRGALCRHSRGDRRGGSVAADAALLPVAANAGRLAPARHRHRRRPGSVFHLGRGVRNRRKRRRRANAALRTRRRAILRRPHRRDAAAARDAPTVRPPPPARPPRVDGRGKRTERIFRPVCSSP